MSLSLRLPTMSRSTRPIVSACTIVLICQAIILYFMGRTFFTANPFLLWTSKAWSPLTSQVPLDPYSTSHVLHGIIFYLALWFLLARLPISIRLLIALCIEISWETLENSPIIINRYRTATASLDYYGDSITNSVSDSLCMIFGFWIAYRLPWKLTFALSIAVELIMIALYRDNLTLNVLMILYPITSLSRWQMMAR